MRTKGNFKKELKINVSVYTENKSPCSRHEMKDNSGRDSEKGNISFVRICKALAYISLFAIQNSLDSRTFISQHV